MTDSRQRLELTVGKVAHGGLCVARVDGRVVFVRHALPGERVIAEVTEESKFLRADAVQILEPSPDRVDPPCPFAGPGRCGGCDWQHASPDAQRRLKAAVVEEQFERLAGLTVTVPVEAVEEQLGWRTRMRFAVRAKGRAGLRRHRSHEVEPVTACLIAHPDVESLGVERHRWRGARSVEAIASSSGERMVTIDPRPRGAVAVPDLDASASIMRGGTPVRGRPYVTEQVGERTFRVTGGGFWQVHPAAPRVLTDAVLELGKPVAGETVLDLYCGAGLFTAHLAEAVGSGGRVLGIESVPSAVRDARHNLRDLPQARVERGQVEDSLSRLDPGRADLVVADPPRTGLGRAVVDDVVRLAPARIAYVSCDPATLARDVAWFREAGYELAGLRAFDIFPMTHHVECVALLTHPA